MSAAIMDEQKIFAANRAVGRIALAVGAKHGRTRRLRVQEEGSLRIRFPNADVDAAEAVIINSAGGMAGGDCFILDIDAGRKAKLLITSAAAEKVYRSLGPDTSATITLNVGAGAALTWLPRETILFDQARLSRRIDIDLADDASLLLAESIVFGRSAMGERVEKGRFIDRWRVRRGGRLIFAETTRLAGAIAERLAEPAVARGGIATAVVLLVPGSDAITAAVRASDFAGEVGVSSWNGIAVMRLSACDGARLHHDLTCVLKALGQHNLPRLWLN